MILVLNKAYGGFSLPQEFCDLYNCEVYDGIERDDARLVSFIQARGGRFGDLVAVEIPDEMTDYEIDEYDGFESVTYVVNGKLNHA